MTAMSLALLLACSSNEPPTSTSTTTSAGAGGSGGSSITGTGGGSSEADAALEAYLGQHFDYISRIGGFYIAGVDKPSLQPDNPGPSGKDIFDDAIVLFSSFLDQDEDGSVDNEQLLQSLATNFVFTINYESVLEPIETQIGSQFNRYAISMKTDVWPYVPSYTGKNLFFTGLRSSMWRPADFNALWEESFHTITEAYNRYESSWSFETGSVLSNFMKADIDAGQYDIEEQNTLEGGDYDWKTAVNEYVHQIWVIQFDAQTDLLNDSQKGVVEHMKQTTGFPMTVNTEYEKVLVVKVK